MLTHMEWAMISLFILLPGFILANADQPPHIVLIVVDDLVYFFFCFNLSFVENPEKVDINVFQRLSRLYF